MKRPLPWSTLALAFAVSNAAAQAPAAAAPPPEVGTVAPDFSVPGITRYGKLADGARLSDYRGQTVVLALFPAARTRG